MSLVGFVDFPLRHCESRAERLRTVAFDRTFRERESLFHLRFDREQI